MASYSRPASDIVVGGTDWISHTWPKSVTPIWQPQSFAGYTTGAENMVSYHSVGPPYSTDNPWSKTLNWWDSPSLTHGPHYIAGQWYKGENRPSNAGIIPPGFTPVNASYYVTKALANVNPRKAHVSLPNFIYELRDLPGMLRDIGRIKNGSIKSSDVPGQYLAAQFGWIPLFNDVVKLVNLAEGIDADMKRFKNALVRKRISGKLAEYVVPTRKTGNGYYRTTVAEYADFEETIKVWFSAKLGSDFQVPDYDSQHISIAFARALGAGQPIAALWNAIPWSFLVDYFINVGDFINANAGGYPQRVKTLCIMVEKELKVAGAGYSTSNSAFNMVEYHSPVCKSHQKNRYVYHDPSPMLTFAPLPFLGRMGILSSLAILQAKRHSGA